MNNFIQASLLIATLFLIVAGNEEEQDLGLEDWVKDGNKNNLGTCRDKFTQLIEKLGFRWVEMTVFTTSIYITPFNTFK